MQDPSSILHASVPGNSLPSHSCVQCCRPPRSDLACLHRTCGSRCGGTLSTLCIRHASVTRDKLSGRRDHGSRSAFLSDVSDHIFAILSCIVGMTATFISDASNAQGNVSNMCPGFNKMSISTPVGFSLHGAGSVLGSLSTTVSVNSTTAVRAVHSDLLHVIGNNGTVTREGSLMLACYSGMKCEGEAARGGSLLVTNNVVATRSTGCCRSVPGVYSELVLRENGR